MTIYEVLSKLTAGKMAGWAVVLLILLLSLVQISPVKLNPWDNIFGWIGKKTNGETEKRLDKLEKHSLLDLLEILVLLAQLEVPELHLIYNI